MSDIVLELPTKEHEHLANYFKEEFTENNERVINGSSLFDQMDFREWLINTQRNNNPETVRKDWVVTTVFFAVRKSDNRIVGMIDIRHYLGNELLKEFAGHIGYAVRPSERGKGYATKMLIMALEYAKSFNITKVMLGCYTDNIGSIKTISKCGGVWTESKLYDGKLMNVYWIDIL